MKPYKNIVRLSPTAKDIAGNGADGELHIGNVGKRALLATSLGLFKTRKNGKHLAVIIQGAQREVVRLHPLSDKK